MTLSPLFLASFILSTAFCISLSSKGLCKSSNFQSIINSQFSNLFCKISFISSKILFSSYLIIFFFRLNCSNITNSIK